VLRAMIALTVLGAGVAHGGPVSRGEFWREAVEPHASEVASILAKVREDFNTADSPPEPDPGGVQRAHYYREALGMARYARRLAPENPSVLRAIAHAAERLGNSREALDALETAARLGGPERVGAGALGDLGALYVRLGRVDDAIKVLRAAQTASTGDSEASTTLVHLADALASRDQLSEAIDLLVSALPLASGQPFGYDLTLAGFALAVMYDRNDQPAAAFDVIDHLQAQLAGQLSPTLQSAIGLVDLAPAEDQHYYAALLYEVMSNYVEARAEWAIYAAMGGRYRCRALEHVAAIDALERAPGGRQ
jgi:tetratricopeptide (TPR) repeat protein